MKKVQDAIYLGEVVHKRIALIEHKLKYRVFSLLLDCDELPKIGKRLKLFSHNKPNLFGLYDKDFGNGTPLPAYLRGVAKNAGKGDRVERFVMLCYPRILGYAFNPITVYFGLDAQDDVCLTVYEVSNTFGERKTYVLPAQPDENGHVWQECPKQFFVSPFNKVSGTYAFHTTPIAQTFTLGVVLSDNNKPVLRAHFHGTRKALTDRDLLKSLSACGFMTVKIVIAIHVEAAKLWFKGLRTQEKPKPPQNAISYFSDPRREN